MKRKTLWHCGLVPNGKEERGSVIQILMLNISEGIDLDDGERISF